MGKPKNLISLAEFLEMKNSFDKTIKKKLGDQETRSVWFSYADLKEYFNYLDTLAKENNVNISGIRFHMIAKTKGNKQLTLALTPTYEKNASHIDFDPSKSSEKTYVALDSIDASNTKDGDTPILNKGLPCPTICP